MVSGWTRPADAAPADVSAQSSQTSLSTAATTDTAAIRATVSKSNIASVAQSIAPAAAKASSSQMASASSFSTKAVDGIAKMKTKQSVRVGLKNGHVDGHLEISNCLNGTAINEVVRWTAPLGLCTPNDKFFGLSDSPFAKFEFRPEGENTWVGSVTGFKDRGCEIQGRVEHYKLHVGCHDGFEVRVVGPKSRTAHRTGLTMRSHVSGE